VDAAAVKFNGLILTIVPNKSACYRCTFPSIPEIAAGQSCKESGVLGPVPGVMGFLQAAEVVKLLSGAGELLCNRIVYFDALDTEFINIKMGRLPDCELCGDHPTINTLIEYQLACESKQAE
jgi:molybdopterin/thiamine biosynthesis adenylyltransferase